MKRNNTKSEQLLETARNVQNGERLLSPDALRSIVSEAASNPAHTGAFEPINKPRYKHKGLFMSGLCALFMISASLWYYSTNSSSLHSNSANGNMSVLDAPQQDAASNTSSIDHATAYNTHNHNAETHEQIQPNLTLAQTATPSTPIQRETTTADSRSRTLSGHDSQTKSASLQKDSSRQGNAGQRDKASFPHMNTTQSANSSESMPRSVNHDGTLSSTSAQGTHGSGRELGSTIPKKIAGIEVLELTKQELEAIGVVFNGTHISVPMEELLDLEKANDRSLDPQSKSQIRARPTLHVNLAKKNYDTTQRFILKRYYSQMSLDGYQGTKILPYTGWKANEYNYSAAVGISSWHMRFDSSARVDSKKWYMYMAMYNLADESPLLKESLLSAQFQETENDSARQHRIDHYATNYITTTLARSSLPVQITIDNFDELRAEAKNGGRIDSSQARRAFVKIWYALSPQFISMLPERYRTPLMKEFGLYSKVVKGELQAEQACNELEQQKSYLDMCRSTSGSVQQLRLAPNPARDYVRCLFELKQSARLTICVYSASGELIARVRETEEYAAGPHDLRLPVEKLSEGMYLIAVLNDNGEQVVQRLMKE